MRNPPGKKYRESEGTCFAVPATSCSLCRCNQQGSRVEAKRKVKTQLPLRQSVCFLGRGKPPVLRETRAPRRCMGYGTKSRKSWRGMGSAREWSRCYFLLWIRGPCAPRFNPNEHLIIARSTRLPAVATLLGLGI